MALRRVSVVVPTQDRPALLRGALASIRALERPDTPIEILVGDNGKSPETPRVAAEFGAIYLHTTRRGCAAARNVALRAATGDYLSFLDDDDVWLPTHLHGHLDLLEANPDLTGVLGQIQLVDADLVPYGAPWPEAIPEDGDMLMFMLAGYFPQMGATVTRMSARQSVGEFDEELIGDQDWDWHMRLARSHGVGFLPVPCMLFRQRRTGTYDELQIRRVHYTRLVFMRHAAKAWKRWRSPRQLLRSYNGSLGHYYQYFVDAASERADQGKRLEALRAITRAFRIVPGRTIRDMLGSSQLRRALITALRP